MEAPVKKGIVDREAIEFTLEDAFEHLKDLREDMSQEIENLTNAASNNETPTIPQNLGEGEITARYHKLIRGLLKSFSKQEIRDLPIPNTIDLQKTMIREIQQVLNQLYELQGRIQSNIAKTKKNIAYLESNKEGLEKMKAACLGAVENVGSETNDAEIEASKRLFKMCKEDLFAVVDTIFPDNQDFKTVLAALTRAYSKGGDEVYIDVEPESLQFVKFLIEANIATFHRNDRSKIKLMELL